MTPNQKTLAWIGGGIAALLLLPRLFPESPGNGGTDPTGNGGIPSAGGGATGGFNARNVADTLYKAMREIGTNETDIFAALRNVSQAQFGQVVTAFGLKQYNMTFGNQYNYDPFSDLEYYGLKDWLRNELDDTDYDILRKKYPLYL